MTSKPREILDGYGSKVRDMNRPVVERGVDDHPMVERGQFVDEKEMRTMVERYLSSVAARAFRCRTIGRWLVC